MGRLGLIVVGYELYRQGGMGRGYGEGYMGEGYGRRGMRGGGSMGRRCGGKGGIGGIGGEWAGECMDE